MRLSVQTLRDLDDALIELYDYAYDLRYSFPDEEDTDDEGMIDVDSEPFALLETITDQLRLVRTLMRQEES